MERVFAKIEKKAEKQNYLVKFFGDNMIIWPYSAFLFWLSVPVPINVVFLNS